MGAYTRSRQLAFQEATGIAPAQGEHALRLIAMKETAIELLFMIDREMTGIRDGYGKWVGSNPIEGLVSNLQERSDNLYSPPGPKVQFGEDGYPVA